MRGIWAAVILSVLLAASPGNAQDEDPKAAEELMVVQLEALKAGNYQQFIHNGNKAFKQFMDEYTFESFKMQRADKLAKGYQLVYFGAIRRLGMQQHIWKVLITDYKYELLGSLSVSHGKVVGFNLE